MRKKSFGKSSEINRKSEDILRYQLKKEFFNLHEITTHQYKIDFIIELLENSNPTGIFFKVELKGVEKQKGKKDYLTFSFETEALKYYNGNILLPVYVIVIDITHEKGFWLFTQKYIDESISKDKLEQKKVTLNIPKKNKLDDSSALYADVKNAHSYMTDLNSTSIFHATNNLRNRLEQLDNRFKVDISSKNGATAVNLIPNSPVSFNISANGDYKDQFLLKMKNIVENGDVEIFDGSKIIIQGSPLFDYLIGELKDIKIFPPKVLLDGLLRTVDKSGNTKTILHGMKVEILKGLKKVIFKCSLKNIILITITIDSNMTPLFKLDYNFRNFINIPFLSLPFLDKLYQLFEDCFDECTLFIDFEEYGNRRGTINMNMQKILDSLNDMYDNLVILYKAKKIYEHYNINPVVTEFVFTTNDIKDILLTYDLLYKGKYIEKQSIWKASAEAIFESPIEKNNLNDTALSLIHGKYIVKIFETDIDLGAVELKLTNAILENSIDEINSTIIREGKANIQLLFKSSADSELCLTLIEK